MLTRGDKSVIIFADYVICTSNYKYKSKKNFKGNNESMLTIFNRRKLILAFSIEWQMKIRDKLHANSIEYKYKVINHNRPFPFLSSRERNQTLGQNMEMVYEYIFFVHRRDYDKAKKLVEKI